MHGQHDLLAIGLARAKLAWLKAREQRSVPRQYPKLALSTRSHDYLNRLAQDLSFGSDDLELQCGHASPLKSVFIDKPAVPR
jgi:hypothetical protein